MNRLTIISLLFTLIFVCNKTSGQVIYSDPALPIADAAVTVYFNATGTSLEGCNDDVYTHTGLILEGNPSWQYVIGSWGNNNNQPVLTQINSNLFRLEITPSIRDYYGASQSDVILRMAFVFRSADAGTQTEDLFLDVYQEEISVRIINPDQRPLFVDPGEEIEIMAEALQAQIISLFVDDELITTVNGNILEYSILANLEPDTTQWIKVIAENGGEQALDSTYYYVRGTTTAEDLPSGVKDGINYNDETSVTLVLHAPYKSSVFVAGEFNNWEIGPEYKMKRTHDDQQNIDNRYWITLSGLTPFKEYAFQYLVGEDLFIADPYAEMILDPWNDPAIPETTYPFLKEYPYGKTQGIASVLQTNQYEYQWEVNSFEPPEPENLVIYELLVRDFTTLHSYKAVTDSLDYLKQLGVNAVELMPVNEFEGNSSWGYNPSFYFAADKYYGPSNKLKELIDECHKRDMAVFIDLTLNHAYNQCSFVRMYFDGTNPTAENPWFNVVSNFTNPDAQWGNDFNHESIYTQQLVDSINSFWMSEYRIDGFRFDFTKGFGNNIKGPDDPWGSKYDADRIALLKRMAENIWIRNPEAIVIFEHLSYNSEENELANHGALLWGNINNNYAEAAMGYNESGKSDFSWISYQKRGWNEPNLVGYMESHDEERLMFKCVTWGNSTGDYSTQDTATALERIALNAAFFFTIPGPKMIWQFGERGYDYSIDYHGRLGEKPPRWDYMGNWRRSYLYRFFSALIKLKQDYETFRTDDFELDVYDSMKKITLRHESMDAVVLGNFGTSDNTIDPDFTHTGDWYDYFTGDMITVTDVNEWILLDPGEYRIYTDVQLPVPQIGTSVTEPSQSRQDNEVLVYPNSTSGSTRIRYMIQDAGYLISDLYSISGMRIERLVEETVQPGVFEHSFDVNDLAPGMYFIRTHINKKLITTKLIVSN